MKKNLFVFTLIAAMGLSLAGCGSSNSETTRVSQNETSNSVSMEADAPKTEAQFSQEQSEGLTEANTESQISNAQRTGDTSKQGQTGQQGNSSITEAQAKEDDFGHYAATETDGIISRDKAIEIVLEKVEGASADDVCIELDNDDGHQVYEGEIRYNRKEYEFELNAEDGSILEWSEEYDD